MVSVRFCIEHLSNTYRMTTEGDVNLQWR